MYGYPRSDIERAMRHYGVSYQQAEAGLMNGTLPLPPRGTGIQTGTARLGKFDSPNYVLIAGVGLLLIGGAITVAALASSP